ncbi:MAG: acetyltransferase, partial [Bacteroidaceae bacterium]|nr:acetyltransferase [Bacteroidaceae bacterium]
PFWNNIGDWLTFLHHENTPVLAGTERIARRYNMACVYLDIRRVRRGYYEAEFQLMTDAPKDAPELSITREYFRRLEQSIRRQPHLWLWTHNRWKRTREEYETMIDPVTGKFKM